MTALPEVDGDERKGRRFRGEEERWAELNYIILVAVVVCSESVLMFKPTCFTDEGMKTLER